LDALPERPSQGEIRSILLRDHSSARAKFVDHFPKEIDAISLALVDVFNRYRDLDVAVGQNIRIATVTAFVFTAANSLVTSVQLLLSGMLIPSGNLMRQYAEASSMALLCSSPALDAFDRFSKNPKTFPVHDSLILVARKHAQRALSVDGPKWKQFMELTKFYDQLSHSTVLALYSQFMFSSPGWLTVGGEFDPGKTKEYGIELTRRVSAAQVLAAMAQELVHRIPSMTPPKS